MKMIKKTFPYILAAVFLWAAADVVRPFWDRYWVKKDMEVTAIYATKNSPEDTRSLLAEKMRERGLDVKADDFSIEKDEKNRVVLSLHYSDKISLFGITLKELEFSLKATAAEVKAYY